MEACLDGLSDARNIVLLMLIQKVLRYLLGYGSHTRLESKVG